MRSMKGASQENLQSHLAEQWFRSIHPKSSSVLFEKIHNLFKNEKINYLLNKNQISY